MSKSGAKKYESRECKSNGGVTYHVFCYLLTDPDELSCAKEAKGDEVRNALAAEKLGSAGGVYFYRFANDNKRFLKIGSTQRKGGIDNRFQRGWSESESNTDSYVWSVEGEGKVKSEFWKHAQSISIDNPAYFVFYALPKDWSIPASDEFLAMSKHRDKYGESPVNVEPEKEVWGSRIVFCPNAFQEVFDKCFPKNHPYPQQSGQVRS